MGRTRLYIAQSGTTYNKKRQTAEQRLHRQQEHGDLFISQTEHRNR